MEGDGEETAIAPVGVAQAIIEGPGRVELRVVDILDYRNGSAVSDQEDGATLFTQRGGFEHGGDFFGGGIDRVNSGDEISAVSL